MSDRALRYGSEQPGCRNGERTLIARQREVDNASFAKRNNVEPARGRFDVAGGRGLRRVTGFVEAMSSNAASLS
ncbi:MAG: hypothetical protein C0483_08595 [Pirellula sp.]|nr:hypothetical protein [Pirellula sp.]